MAFVLPTLSFKHFKAGVRQLRKLLDKVSRKANGGWKCYGMIPDKKPIHWQIVLLKPAWSMNSWIDESIKREVARPGQGGGYLFNVEPCQIARQPRWHSAWSGRKRRQIRSVCGTGDISLRGNSGRGTGKTLLLLSVRVIQNVQCHVH